MKITEALIARMAALSRLELDDAERASMTAELAQIVGYMDILDRADVAGVEPMGHVLDVVNVLRADTVEPSLDREALLQNAPERDKETFLVPRAVD